MLRSLSDVLHQVLIAAGELYPDYCGADAIGRFRGRHDIATRTAFYLLARREARFSYPEIAAAICRRNHSSVMTSLGRYHRNADPPEVREICDAIVAQVEAHRLRGDFR